ncbi:MAG: magnesium chelatase [Proteobacteria bacterium]|nr:magnesium chelatase [Pseudomonadota bacterium]
MIDSRPGTLGELKRTMTRLPSVREELQANMIRKLRSGEPLFPSLKGYDDSVIPQLVNAVLCGHNLILLGERGQGKSRLIRSMVDFLDETIPAVEGCPVNDDPFNPICSECRRRKAELGDDLPLTYLPRDRRLVEKLATSDVSTADLIGEVDPIKIAQGRTMDDETAIHFGLVPRAHRGIFAVNELPDLAEKIQVAFFNVMEESDFQVKGFPVRLPLDILVVATANPEDYTNRGRIITPLKDRFDSQIRTHYPLERNVEIEIMEQEARAPRFGDYQVAVPDFMKDILAEITFQARSSPDVNQHSGVSCRVTIRSYEAIVGSAARRCLELKEDRAVPRVSDIEAAYPAMVGKIELEYEAADRSEMEVIEDLFRRAVKVVFDERFKNRSLETVVQAFQNGMGAEVSRSMPSLDYMDALQEIPGMREAVRTLADPDDPGAAASAIEFILEGLHLSNKLNRDVVQNRRVYR